MKKVQAVVRLSDREPFLDALGALGVMHVTPVNPPQAVPESEVTLALDNVRRAARTLAGIEPAGEKPAMSAREAAHEVNTIHRNQVEYDNRLTSLYRQLEQQAVWGDLTLEDFQTLQAAGALPDFYRVPRAEAEQIETAFSAVVQELPEEAVAIAIIGRTDEYQMPESAELIPLPTKDNRTIRAEAAEIDERRRQSTDRLAQLAHLLPEIQSLESELAQEAELSAIANGAYSEADFFAIEGWMPAWQAETLATDLASADILSATREFEPTEDERPPTLIKYPGWAKPIKGLFDMLGTFPGYREMDLSAFFMIAMPIFSAMLAGDAAYGLLFLIPCLLFYRRIKQKIGPESTQLLLLFGAATFVWGLLSANFFGVKPDGLAEIMPLERESDEATQWLLIKISFIIGSVHLITAHIRKAMGLFPDSRAIADIGWSLALAGMLGVIWYMVFDSSPVPSLIWLIGLAVGLVLAIGFTAPNPNPLKRIGIGFASSLLPLISTFSDTMSYIRLMAVGMASYYIAYAFNDLGSTIAGGGTWAAAAPVLVFGHALNIILILIAIFAHGVRLNMLEFSNNAGVEWAGYPYNPFRKVKT